MRRSFLFVLASFALGVSPTDPDVADSVRRLREQSVLLVGSDAKTILAQEWAKFDAGTLERREQALRRVRELGKRLADDQNAGRSRECSSQIFLEAKRRAIYTADFEAIERRIRDLETSLGNDNQAHVAQQSPVDGSWGVCFEPTFMKLEATTLRLQMLHQKNVAPNYALNLLPDVRSGKGCGGPVGAASRLGYCTGGDRPSLRTGAPAQSSLLRCPPPPTVSSRANCLLDCGSAAYDEQSSLTAHGRLEEETTLSPNIKGGSRMVPFTGIANPEQLAVMTEAFEGHCLQQAS